MDRVREAFPRASMQFIATGKHSPHSEKRPARVATQRRENFSQQQLGVLRQELQIQTGIRFLRDDGNHCENVLT